MMEEHPPTWFAADTVVSSMASPSLSQGKPSGPASSSEAV